MTPTPGVRAPKAIKLLYKETIMNIELVIRSSMPRDIKRITLQKDGDWMGGLDGKFMTPLEEELPVNNLFLLLENTSEADPHLLQALEGLADQDQDLLLSLFITKDDGNTLTVPIRSVSYGKDSVSFYRQSVHQTLEIA